MGGRSHRPPCKLFRQGTCRNGDNCRFKHATRSTDSITSQIPQHTSSSTAEQRAGDPNVDINGDEANSVDSNSSDGRDRLHGRPASIATTNQDVAVSHAMDLSLPQERTAGGDDTVAEEEEDPPDVGMAEGDESETESEVEFDFEDEDEPERDHEQSVATTTSTQNTTTDDELVSPQRVLKPVALDQQHQSLGGGNGNENENDGSVDEVEQNPQQLLEAPPPAPPTSSRYVYTEVELPADEELLRVVVARTSQFMDPTQRRLPVWHSIATLLGDRFPKGGEAAQARVVWLQKVCKNPLHHQHALLTPELKQMIQQYEEARASNSDPGRRTKKRKRVESVDSSHGRDPRRRVSATPVGPQAVEQATAEEEGATLASSVLPDVAKDGVVTLNVELEEQFMALMLQYGQALATSERREKLWDAIALASNGRFKMGSSARNRLMWLLKIRKTPTHREYSKLTPALRDMLTQFLAFNPFARLLKSRTPASGKSNQLPVSTSDYQPATACVAPAGTTPTTATPAVATAAATASKKRRVNDPWLTIQPEMDESLMKLVVEKRPFDGDRYTKPVIWAEITQALLDPRIHDGVSGLGRVRWLVNVYANGTHPEHARLTPKLRELLPKYVDLYAAARAQRLVGNKQPEETGQASGSTRNGTAAQSGRDECGDPSTDTTISTTSPVPSTATYTSAADVTIPGSSSVPLSLEKDALLREVLRVRPFHREDEQRAFRWNQVADNLAQRLGSRAAFPSGAFCKTQMRRLYGEMLQATRPRRSSWSSSRVVLTESQSKMHDLLDRFVQMSARSLNQLQTEELRLLVAEIDAFLGALPPQTQAHGVWERVCCSTTPNDEAGAEQDQEQTLEQEQEQDPTLEHDQEPDREQDPESEDDNEHGAERTSTNSHKRHPKSHRHKTRPKHKRKHSSESTADTQLDALRAEVLHLRTLCASSALERAQFTTQIATLQEEVATCRTQLAVQGATLDQERREHRAELRAMVDVLVRERESHQRATVATLDVIQKDREDRREEFTAMMNLVTRSVTSSESRRS